jgi:hypothetical protein
MPAVHRKRDAGFKRRTPRSKPPTMTDPEPGIGGYDYPRGPFGATGFPGSTPASPRTKTEQRPDGARGLRQLDPEANQAEWAMLPTRRVNGTPRQPYARQMRSTAPETRMTPVIGGAPGSENVRNQVAQRYKARPELVREYRASPNPGKTGAVLDGPSRFHPGTVVHGHPDGKPVPGMAPQPGYPPMVAVQSRYVSDEGAQEGYAVNRPLLFAKGGTPAAQPPGAAPHVRGGRYSGLRYFGDLGDQQRIGLPSDSFGIARARGPRHRPVQFVQPAPHAASYYDLPPEADEPPDMIHRSPGRGRPHASRPRRG